MEKSPRQSINQSTQIVYNKTYSYLLTALSPSFQSFHEIGPRFYPEKRFLYTCLFAFYSRQNFIRLKCCLECCYAWDKSKWTFLTRLQDFRNKDNIKNIVGHHLNLSFLKKKKKKAEGKKKIFRQVPFLHQEILFTLFTGVVEHKVGGSLWCNG